MDFYKEMPEVRTLCINMFSPYLKIIERNIEFFSTFDKENRYDYNYADMYAYGGEISDFFDKKIESDIIFEKEMAKVFKDSVGTDEEIREFILKSNKENKRFNYFVKYNQGWNYVIASIKEFNRTTISIRTFWRDVSDIKDDLTYIRLKDKTDFDSKGKLSLLFEKYSNCAFTDFPSRPSLDFILKNGFRYKDARDFSSVADFKIEKDVITIEEGFDYKKLITVLSNLDITNE